MTTAPRAVWQRLSETRRGELRRKSAYIDESTGDTVEIEDQVISCPVRSSMP
jgi:hypothetical protein